MIARVIIAGTMVSAMLLACTRTEAQTPVHSASASTPVQSLTNELCSCFSAIDLAAKDNVIDAQVKRCMEEAILRHPGAVRTLIQQGSKQNSVGFDLGRTLGSLLDKSCAAYQKVKNRLRPGRAEAGVRNSDS